jgi:serine/threonine protein kinase
MEIINKITDTVLEKRWHIVRSLGEGAFGKIFQAYDLKKTTQGVPRPVIVKFTKNHDMNDREYRALKEVVRYVKKQRGENPFYASTHSKGKVIINDKIFYEGDKNF